MKTHNYCSAKRYQKQPMAGSFTKFMEISIMRNFAWISKSFALKFTLFLISLSDKYYKVPLYTWTRIHTQQHPYNLCNF